MGKINKNNSAEKAFDRDMFILSMVSFDSPCVGADNLVPGMDYDPSEWDYSLAEYDALIEDRILAGDWLEVAQLRKERKACEVSKRRAKAAHFQSLTETNSISKEIAYI